MGLDRRSIRSIWLAAGLGPVSFGAYRELLHDFPDWPWIPLGAAGSALALGGSWLVLHKRYRALGAADLAAEAPLGQDPQALRDRLVLAFFRHDPANLLLDDRDPAAYRREVDALIGAFPDIRTEAQLRTAIHRLLFDAFRSAPDPHDASLHALASEIWRLIQPK